MRKPNRLARHANSASPQKMSGSNGPACRQTSRVMHAFAVAMSVRWGDYSDLILRVLDPSLVCLVDPWAEGFDINGKVEFYPNWDLQLRTAYSSDTESEHVCRGFKSEIDRGTVSVHRGFSYEVVSEFSDHFFDFIYIDACHVHEAVRRDLEHYLPKLRAGGLLGGHDYVEHPAFRGREGGR